MQTEFIGCSQIPSNNFMSLVYLWYGLLLIVYSCTNPFIWMYFDVHNLHHLNRIVFANCFFITIASLLLSLNVSFKDLNHFLAFEWLTLIG